MATLTIRDLDDTPKQSLRNRAVHRNHSMGEEARQILYAAMVDTPGATVDLARRIRARFAALGDVSLPIADRADLADREPVRPPPPFEAADPVAQRPAAATAAAAAAATAAAAAAAAVEVARRGQA